MRDFPPLYSAVVHALAEALMPAFPVQNVESRGHGRTARISSDSVLTKHSQAARTLNHSGLRQLRG